MGLVTRVRGLFHRKAERFDAYLLSFPKCGRTWLTLQIGRAMQVHFGLTDANPVKLRAMVELDRRVPRIRVTHDDDPHRRAPAELVRSKAKYRGEKVIFLVRDPRDVLVSYYFQRTKREPPHKIWFFQKKRQASHGRFDGSLSDFLGVSVGGFDTILSFYNIWAESRVIPAAFLLVRYEDMHANSARELRRVLEFLGLTDVTESTLGDAVEFASFERMHKMEADNQLESYKLRPGDVNDADSFKVRRGKVRGYTDYLKPEEVEMLNRKMAASLSALYGYMPCRADS